jgi:hypothetical protein
VIGQGRKPRLLYDELDVLQWAQGCLSIAEQEPDVNTLRAMLAQFRLTLQDAQSYGFEAARFAFGSMLSLMEDGTLVWGDGHRLSEEWRSALVARAPHQREFWRENVSHAPAEVITSRARPCGNTCVNVALGPTILNQLALYPRTLQGHHRLLV